MTCNGDLRGIGGFQDVVTANLIGSGGLQVTVSCRIDPFPPIGLEPATYAEALAAQYLHGSWRTGILSN
jgi:hypothetical protein